MSKTELKRLCTQNPSGMAERMHALETERDELRTMLGEAEAYLRPRIKDTGGYGETRLLPKIRALLEKQPI